MKVFISYSSRDKWIARRISDDLAQRGIETFLDEKDIETGDSIDDALQEHLNECDELLMLLSPTALSSHWVLLEIGGAKALQKRLVPILLHVGANELPSPLNKGLARDLNDIDRYYEEIEARGATEGAADIDPQPLRLEDGLPDREKVRRSFEVGDYVRLPETPQDSPGSDGPGWVLPMNEHLGKIGQIFEVDQNDRTARVDVADRWWWDMNWLAPTDPPAGG